MAKYKKQVELTYSDLWEIQKALSRVLADQIVRPDRNVSEENRQDRIARLQQALSKIVPAVEEGLFHIEAMNEIERLSNGETE